MLIFELNLRFRKIDHSYSGPTVGPTPITSPRPASAAGAFTFHSKVHGSAVKFLNNYRTAAREDPLNNDKNAVVFTSRPLETEELFEIHIDKRIKGSDKPGSVEIGVTTVNPQELSSVPATMTDCKVGQTWMYSGAEMLLNSLKVANMPKDIYELQSTGKLSKLGVKRDAQGRLDIFVNGEYIGTINDRFPTTIYGVVDIYMQTVQVSITSPKVEAPIEKEEEPSGQTQEAAKSTSPTSPPPPPITFRKTCGKNVEMSSDQKTATRRNYMTDCDNGIVLSSRPLQSGEMFEIRVDKTISKWDHEGLKIGLVDLHSGFEIPRTLPGQIAEVTWSWVGDEVFHDRRVEKKLNMNLNRVKNGDRVGVMRASDNTVHFFYNGQDFGAAADRIPEKVFAIVDVHGCTFEVSLNMPDTEMETKQTAPGPNPNSEVNTALMKMKQTVELLKIKNEASIKKVKQMAQENLLELYRSHQDPLLRKAMGEKFTEMQGATHIVDYIKFLRECGLEVDYIQECYSTLRKICVWYSDDSLKFARALGETDLLAIMVSELQKYKNKSYETDEKLLDVVKTNLILLHNCAKVTENRGVIRRLQVIDAILPYRNSKIKELSTHALMALSYMVAIDEHHYIQADENSIAFILQILEEAFNNKTTHMSETGYHVDEVLVGLANLAKNKGNRINVVKKQGVNTFVKIMKLGRPSEQECAAMALLEMVDDTTVQHIAATPGLHGVLATMKNSPVEAVRQASERLLLKLPSQDSFVQMMPDMPKPTAPKRRKCDYKEICNAYMKTLNLNDAFFDHEFDRCYCSVCHTDRGDDLYYTRGDPPKDYGIPAGWCRYALSLPAKAKAMNVLEAWHRAYHGTRSTAVAKILQVGELLMPGDTALGGEKISVCKGHFTEERKPEGFNIKKIFVSPSIRYAGHNAYAMPHKYKDATTEKNYVARVAFQICIRPDSYVVGDQTIGALSQIDPKFDNQEIEWATEERGSTVLYGLLVKLEEEVSA
ncbi:neuralized-like protein 4 [Lingula anatina]|uniref:Neuralized-like protein 4 n=1 Tax=Lingula anatina TaxID=7574 RepID=A0A1S3K7E7_LINAN|nr:neuralized-like protein 4 [Lingula anatina]|eukprot:XP_013418417.1 neuralized-like protein 4 [Lingula anatina]